MAVRTNRTRKMSKSVVVNREALTELGLGLADGLLAIGERAVTTANVPDAPPYGEGLVETGAWVVYIEKKKVGGNATLRRTDKSGIVLYAGFGFPARLQELGSVNQPPRPFFTPSFMAAARDIAPTLRPYVAGRLRGVR